MTPSSPAPRRADATRNRARLLDAARAAFAAGQDDATLGAIAGRAGVGIGTLYRHFPSREALIEAVYRDELAQLHRAAPALLTAHPPDVALRAWLDRFAAYVTAKRGMADTLRALVASGDISMAETRAGLTAALGELLRAGAREGSLRDDVDPRDVLALLVGVFLAAGAGHDAAQPGRMLDVLADGLRATSPPASPVTGSSTRRA